MRNERYGTIISILSGVPRFGYWNINWRFPVFWPGTCLPYFVAKSSEDLNSLFTRSFNQLNWQVITAPSRDLLFLISFKALRTSYMYYLFGNTCKEWIQFFSWRFRIVMGFKSVKPRWRQAQTIKCVDTKNTPQKVLYNKIGKRHFYFFLYERWQFTHKPKFCIFVCFFLKTSPVRLNSICMLYIWPISNSSLVHTF